MIPQPKRPRVVMVCDDGNIDRRIIREALTLIAQGWDPVVVAFNAGGPERAYWEEGVAVVHVNESSNVPLVRYYLGADAADWSASLRQIPGARRLWKRAVRAARWARDRGLLPQRLKMWHLKRLAYVAAIPLAPLAPRWWAYKRRQTAQDAERDRLAQLWRFTRLHVAEVAAATILYHEPDLIVSHDLPMLAPGALAAELAGVPLIYDSHELYTEIHTLHAEVVPTLRESEAFLIKEADAVFTVNEFIARELADRYGIEEPGVLYNATTLPTDWQPPYDVIRSQLGLQPNDKIVLFHGWFTSGRNLEALVDSFALLPPSYHLCLLGFGDYGQALSLRAAPFTERVHLLAAVPQTEVLYWVASADLGVIPYAPIDKNTLYCSPNKLFDFLLCQVPVLAYDSPFLKKTLASQGLGLNAKLDSPDAFRDGILASFEPQTYRTMKERLSVLGQRYDWVQEGTKLVSVVDAVMTCHSTARASG